MSDRNSLYGDSSHTDPWEAAQQHPETGSSGGQDATDEVLARSNEALNKAEEKGQRAMDAMQQRGEEAREQAGRVAGTARDRADEGMHRAAQTMDQAAEKLRQRGGEQGGTVGQVASTAADTLDSASSYLERTDTGEMIDQVEAYIRKNPVQSLLIAAGVGFVLSKAFK